MNKKKTYDRRPRPQDTHTQFLAATSPCKILAVCKKARPCAAWTANSTSSVARRWPPRCSWRYLQGGERGGGHLQVRWSEREVVVGFCEVKKKRGGWVRLLRRWMGVIERLFRARWKGMGGCVEGWREWLVEEPLKVACGWCGYVWKLMWKNETERMWS